jgi:hypothetical protein
MHLVFVNLNSIYYERCSILNVDSVILNDMAQLRNDIKITVIYLENKKPFLTFFCMVKTVTSQLMSKPFLMIGCLIVAVRIINDNQYKFDNFYNL